MSVDSIYQSLVRLKVARLRLKMHREINHVNFWKEEHCYCFAVF